MSEHQLCLVAALICFCLAAGGAKGLSWRDGGFAFATLSILIG